MNIIQRWQDFNAKTIAEEIVDSRQCLKWAQEEINELRAALAARDAELARTYGCINSHAKITQAAEVKVEEQRKVLERALAAMNKGYMSHHHAEYSAAITAIQEQLK